jgi:YVTN family beta-propeller protein
MFSGARMMRRKSSGLSCRLQAIFLFAALVTFACAPNAFATRLPDDIKDTVDSMFIKSTIRPDGSVETKSGALYVLLMPVEGKKKPKLITNVTWPSKENPEFIVLDNGWAYLRVQKRGKKSIIALPDDLDEKLARQLLTYKLPADLIVPEGFVIPKSLKFLLGDVNVPVVDDEVINKADFGREERTAQKLEENGPGHVLLTSISSGSIDLLDGKDLGKVMNFPTEGTPSGMVYVDGKVYIADQAKDRVLILDPTSKQFLGQIDLAPHSHPKSLATLPNGKLIYVAESGTSSIAVIETDTQKVLLRTKVAGPGRIAMVPNGTVLVVLNVPSGMVTFLSTINQAVFGTLKVGSMPTSVAISPDSRYAYISCRMNNAVYQVDVVKRKVESIIPVGAGPTGLALNPDGTKICVANARENTIAVYDVKTKQKLKEFRLPVEMDFPEGIRLLPDGQRLVVSSEGSDTIAILNLQSLEFENKESLGHSSHDIIWVPI